MSVDFDPYFEWFGVKTESVPPDHYSLLGIERFESDEKTIEKAIERRVEFLQDIASGERTAESQRLLNEVAAARLCLSNENKKTQYDSELRSGRVEKENAAEVNSAKQAIAKKQNSKPNPNPKAAQKNTAKKSATSVLTRPDNHQKKLKTQIMIAAMLLPSLFLGLGLIIYVNWPEGSKNVDSSNNRIESSQLVRSGNPPTNIRDAARRNVERKNPNGKLAASPLLKTSGKKSPLAKTKTKKNSHKKFKRIVPAKEKVKKNSAAEPKNGSVNTDYAQENPVSKGIIFWLDASDESTITVEPNNRVSAWTDKQSKKRIAQQPNDENRPIYHQGDKNNRRSIEFKSPMFMTVADSSNSNPGEKYTIYYVGRFSNGVLISKGDVSGNKPSGSFALYGKHKKEPALRLARTTYIKAKGADPNIWKVYSVRKTASQVKWFRNGESLSGQNIKTKLISGDPIILGQEKDNKAQMNGMICELIIYAQALDGSKQTQVNGYLRRKWGIR